MDTIEQNERRMWDCAAARDSVGFARLVSQDAVMVCGGYRCSGSEYAGIISQFDVDRCFITGFELVALSSELVQTHYIVTVESENAPDLAGTFHVTSIWRLSGDVWTLIFNMDSRISA